MIYFEGAEGDFPSGPVKCGGCGQFLSPETRHRCPQDNPLTMEQIAKNCDSNPPPHAIPCYKCEGYAQVKEYDYTMGAYYPAECPDCKGKGWI